MKIIAIIRRLFFGLATACVLIVMASPHGAHSQELDRIIKDGTIKVAVDFGNAPFGMQDKDMKPVGYDIDVAEMLAKDLGVKLELVSVNSPNRIPYLMTKRADVTIASLSITTDRAKSVSFSNPYCALSSALMARKDLQIKGPADLAGKKISVARGTTNEADMLAVAPPTAQVVRFDDEASATGALLAGQVDAYVTGDTILKETAKKNPDASLEIKFALRYVYSGIAIRRGDADFQRWINTFVAAHKSGGDFGKLYSKWFGGVMPDLPVF